MQYIFAYIYMLSCYNDFIMSVIKQLLFTATIYAIYAQYMYNIYSVLLPLLSVLHTHTHEHMLWKKKSLLAVWSSWNAKQIRGTQLGV